MVGLEVQEVLEVALVVPVVDLVPVPLERLQRHRLGVAPRVGASVLGTMLEEHVLLHVLLALGDLKEHTKYLMCDLINNTYEVALSVLQLRGVARVATALPNRVAASALLALKQAKVNFKST